MADTKITALTALTTADPANDMMPIVDVSDTTMAASGTTKRISINNILACSPSATLASATITGDLTVDTSTLKVDSTNNRVGIGTATPTAALDILGAFGTSTAAAVIRNNSAANASNISQVQFFAANSFAGSEQVASIHGSNPNAAANNGGALVFSTSLNGTGTTPTERYRIGNDGTATWSVGGSTAMTLNSTGLGVGVSPSYKLDVNGVARVNSGGDGLFLSAASSPDLYIVGTNYYNNNGTEGVQVSARPSWKIEHKNSSDALAYLDIGFRAASAAASAFTSRFKIDGSGNVGIGVTPSAGKGCLQLSSGINFPATQVASSDANTLDDYIERTWTGTLKGSVSDPTTPVTATGRITKIGRKVMAEITFSNVSTVGASGAISITGLPYTNNASVNGVGIASLNLIGTFTGSPVSFITIGGSTIELYADVSNGASTQITHNAGVARFMTIQITYTV